MRLVWRELLKEVGIKAALNTQIVTPLSIRERTQDGKISSVDAFHNWDKEHPRLRT